MNKIILDQKNLARLAEKLNRIRRIKIPGRAYCRYEFLTEKIRNNFPKKYFRNCLGWLHDCWVRGSLIRYPRCYRILTIVKYDHHNRKIHMEINKP